MKILVVDDEKIKRVTLADDLATQGHEVITASDGEEALRQLAARRFDVVVTDLKMPKCDGIELLKQIKRGPLADMEVIMMTAYGSIPVAVEAVKLGAFDFLTKPFRNEDLFPLLARIERSKQSAARRARPPEQAPPPPLDADIGRAIVARSAAMEQVKRMVEICESELYGHEKGSFTGADQQREGRFALAEGGTLYLDDVDDIPLAQQPKLLRAIDEKVFERVGGTTPIKANVRIIASTKRNLLDQISEGTFREDLYYRLDVLRVNIPPLRERLDDLPLLTKHLLARISGDRPCHIDPQALEVLKRHDWPGNVRELSHTLERAYLIGSGHITAELLTAEMSGIANHRGASAEDFQAAIERTERELLENALRASGGNKTAAAAALGMKPSTFRDKLAKHGLG
jgi:DNA-binding NtrC family response regulator